MTGVKVTVTVTSVPPSDKPLGGAVVSLTKGDSVVKATTSPSGTATFPDVEPGGYQAAVEDPPDFFVAQRATAVKAVAVAQADKVEELTVVPLVLTLTSTPPAPGKLDFAQVEVWKVGGAKVSTVDLESGVTKVPIAEPGRYQVRTVQPFPGRVQPPNELGPKALLSVEAPAAELLVPERAAALKVTVKLGDTAASTEQASAVKVMVRDALGRVPAPNLANITLRRTGKHTITVLEVPTGTRLESGSPHEFNVPWTDDYGAGDNSAIEVPHEIVLRENKASTHGASIRASGIVLFAVIAFTALCGAAAIWDLPLLGGKQEAALVTLVAPMMLLTVGLGLLLLAGWDKRGIFEPLVGADGRTSVSRIAPALWTLALVVVVCRNAGLVHWDGEKLADSLEANWDDYLILLGGPWAAAVLAKATVSWKVDNGKLQKTTANEPEILDAIRDDNGRTSLVDAQYLLFNLVAMLVFGAAYIADGPDLPKIPSLLLAMTSGAAAVYVGNKAAEQNRPTVTGLIPPTVRAGDELTVSGTNFLPAGSTAADGVTVSLTGYGVLPPIAGKPPTDTRVTVEVPGDVPAGFRDLTVTSAAKVTTEPRSIEVVSSDLVIAGLAEPALVPGDTVHLLVDNLRNTTEGRPTTYLVSLDGQWVPARLTVEERPRLEVTAPRSIAGSTVAVSVRDSNGRTSGATSVAVDGGPKITNAVAARLTGTGKVQVRIDAVGVLTPNSEEHDQSAVNVGGTPASFTEKRTVSGSRDRLVVTADVADTASAINVTVVDWMGRTSAPRRVEIP